MYINNVLYCFYSSDTEALEACFRLLHDDDDEDAQCQWSTGPEAMHTAGHWALHCLIENAASESKKYIEGNTFQTI